MKTKAITVAFACFSLWVSILSCQNSGQIEQAQYFINGKLAYELHCQNCHGAKGEGLKLLIPPLTDTAFIKANLGNIAGYIKYGISGEMWINGQLYNGEMPAETHLTPIEITYIINYIGNSFGNDIGFYSLEQVENDLNAYTAR